MCPSSQTFVASNKAKRENCSPGLMSFFSRATFSQSAEEFQTPRTNFAARTSPWQSTPDTAYVKNLSASQGLTPGAERSVGNDDARRVIDSGPICPQVLLRRCSRARARTTASTACATAAESPSYSADPSLLMMTRAETILRALSASLM